TAAVYSLSLHDALPIFGTSGKLVIAPKPLLTICAMPDAPPMKKIAATMFVAKKAIATGTPSIMSPTPSPNSTAAAAYHCIAQTRSEEHTSELQSLAYLV